jgi:hypothetical protein
MVRWSLALLCCGTGLLLAPVNADPVPAKPPLAGDLITAVTRVERNVEKDDTVGFITVGGAEVRVTSRTKITRGPGDLVYRGFGSLRIGCRVLVSYDAAEILRNKDKLGAKPLTASAIDILLDPVPGKVEGLEKDLRDARRAAGEAAKLRIMRMY